MLFEMFTWCLGTVEVEELLGPDEKSILHQNVAPNLEMLSTVNYNVFSLLLIAEHLKFISLWCLIEAHFLLAFAL